MIAYALQLEGPGGTLKRAGVYSGDVCRPLHDIEAEILRAQCGGRFFGARIKALRISELEVIRAYKEGASLFVWAVFPVRGRSGILVGVCRAREERDAFFIARSRVELKHKLQVDSIEIRLEQVRAATLAGHGRGLLAWGPPYEVFEEAA